MCDISCGGFVNLRWEWLMNIQFWPEMDGCGEGIIGVIFGGIVVW